MWSGRRNLYEERGMSIRDSLKPLVRKAIVGWAFLTRAAILGVRGVVRRGDGAVLLVRHSYLPGWYLPGGGVDPGETLAEAFAREVMEETGVALAGPPRLVSMHLNRGVSRRDHVGFFVAQAVDGELGPSPSPREIVETGWFLLDRLPEGTTAGTRRRLAEVCDGVPASPTW
jgi:8-oxo-dGTP pyrophosphatase MutT (NUDIX family)